MRNMLFLVVLCLFSVRVNSAQLVMEAPIKDYGTPVTVAISSTTLTKVPTSQLSGRIGIFISNPFANPFPVSGFFGNCTSTALANTIRPIEIASSTSSWTNQYISMREDVCLWLLSTDTGHASATIHYQEVKQ